MTCAYPSTLSILWLSLYPSQTRNFQMVALEKLEATADADRWVFRLIPYASLGSKTMKILYRNIKDILCSPS